MKKGGFWAIFSLLMVIILTATSCGSNRTQETTPATTATATTSTTVADLPKYGGVFTLIPDRDILGFDDAHATSSGLRTLSLTQEELWQGDWARGPAGTDEVTWAILTFEGIHDEYIGRGLAESWELDVPTLTRTFHIRKGVYWHDKAPTNGRELVADDIVFSIERMWSSPDGYVGKGYPGPKSVTATDRYAVEVTYNSFTDLTTVYSQLCDFMTMWPRDAVEYYGDMKDWKNSIGTGPYILTDYVKGSQATFVRNPKYWDTDPVGPGKGNQLPYPDGVKYLFISDIATQEASMRTGKADWCGFAWESAASIKKSTPDLLDASAVSVSVYALWFRVDNPDKPWYNKSVRQAIHMAIDYDAIVDEYYGGEGEWYAYPAPAIPEARDYRVPFEQLPANVRELFSYNVDKAKQMLTDAGYATGFDMEVVCTAADADLLSIYKDYLSKIGVNLIIAIKDPAVYNSVGGARSYTDTYWGTNSTVVPFHFVPARPASQSPRNWSMSEDVKIDEAWKGIWDNFFNWNERCRIFREITPYILDEAWGLPSIANYNHFLWQPWLKNYHGEFSVGMTTRYNFAKWVWIDQDLKEQKTGTR